MTEIEAIEMRMMTVALGQAIGYGEINEAKRIQGLMMDWLVATDDVRRELYRGFRNEGSVVAGLDCA